MLSIIQQSGRSYRFVRYALLLLLCLTYVSQTVAQDNCATVVTDAQNLYEVGRTADMIARLEKCLPDGVTAEADKVQAYKLLSLAYIAEDFPSGARNAIEKILDINENYEPDQANDPSLFIEYVEEAKQNRAQKKGGKKKYFFIGGGIVLVSAVALVLTSGSDPPPAPRLPDAPAFPPAGQ